jgi:type VI secretion system secreted protein VgrG
MSADPRGLSITTPLGPDTLFVTTLRGREGLSQLFQFQLDLMAENRTVVAFDKLLGQKVTISILLPDSKTKRFFTGICSRISQSGRDSTFTTYRMEVVPQLWLLTRRTQCRIFQHINIPDILKKVFTGLDVKFELQGTFEPRDYCVQYRESDFDFASRLMEEEGIYYYFKHTDGGHQMIVANSPQSHQPVVFAEKAIYEELQGGNRPDMRVHHWEKTQELRSGKVTLWDHCFELPHQHLDATRPTPESVAVGKVTHKLKLAANDPLELYDYPGSYAQRFDGVDPGGGDKAGDLAKIFQDNKRTAAIRMDQEAVDAIIIHGASNCRQFSAGHKFTLERHYDADGPYVLTTVEHTATASASGRSSGSDDGSISYSNHFTCLPLSLPFRPPMTTYTPLISGPQTAVVVGLPGEKIFCDKYGRVKVQFHWDREGKNNADSSCWVRVSQNWAGANWGGMFIPHVGQEVIVEFEEGDPDRPLITGRVYNAECMPPLELPANKTKSIIRDHGGSEIIMEGEAGKQQIRLHCPKHQTTIHMGNSFWYDTKSDWKSYTEGEMKWEIGKDHSTLIHGSVKFEVGKNVTDITAGWLHKTIVGLTTNVILGGKIDNIAPYERKNVGGWTQTTIVGWKREVIGGAQTSILGGKKTETIRGNTTKVHVGRALEYRNTSLDEKTPSRRQLAKEAKNLHKTSKEVVDAQKKIEVGAANLSKATDQFIEATSDADIVAAGDARIAATQMIMEGHQEIKKCGKYKAVAGSYIVNNGTLSVK